ncbi:MAG: polymer-forming cytoskeletal protein [Chitinophagaceae bacterium]|nr:polymer-forming cytoskeletal protein [Chitinophagaceae bacterium]
MISLLLRRCAFFLLLVAAGILPASAMVVESGNTIVIEKPTNEDIYLVAGTVIINAPAHGDLVVAGGKIYINDTVNDVLLAGGTVVINGYVSGKIRCMGGTLRIDRNVQGDLVAAGGEITVQRNASVLGDVLVSGGNLVVYGNISGDIRTATGRFRLIGTAGRNLDCRGGTIELYGKVMGSSSIAVSEDLVIGERAVFEGPVRYWAPSDVSFGASVKNGKAVRDVSLAIKRPHWYYLGTSSWLIVFWYLASALLVIILLQYLFPHLFERAGEKTYNSMLRSLGSGIVYFVATPLIIFISFVSLIAIPVGLALLLGYILAFLICGSITALVASHWFGHVMGSTGRFWEYVWIAFGFFILFRLIFSIPFFGWILSPLLVCIAFGALFSSVRWRKGKAPAA